MEQSVAEATAIFEHVVTLITTYGLDVIGAVIILIAGWIGAGWAQRAVSRTLAKTDKVDAMLRGFFASVVRYFVIVFTVLAVLAQFGIETTSLIAVFGAAGLAVGLALQGALSDLAAGVMLLLFRPFKIGDYIDAGGIAGTVKTVGLFLTEMATPDNVQILVPNSKIWGAPISNFSHHATRRVDLVMGIAYGDSIDKAMEAVHAVIGADPRTHDDPAPMVVVGALADSSVNLTVRLWCDAADYWPLRFDLTKALKERFDAEGLTIPFPQRDVHLIRAQGEAA